jgi:hypothetical protein
MGMSQVESASRRRDEELFEIDRKDDWQIKRKTAVQRSTIYFLILKCVIGIGFDNRELTNLTAARIMLNGQSAVPAWTYCHAEKS